MTRNSEGKRMKKTAAGRLLAMTLCVVLLGLTACGDTASGGGKGGSGGKTSGGKTSGKQTGVTEISGEIKAQPVSVSEPNPSATVAATDFGLRLFRENMQAGENVLLSPVSVLFALGMTANGAGGNTLAQFESVFGMPVEELNLYLYAYRNSLPNEENCKVTAANSIWLRQDPSLSVSRDFLQKNADYYAAGVYEAPFDDDTKDAINQWVEENTDGMIDQILDKIPEDAVMYLVNAMAFDAKWQRPYYENNVSEGTFTKEDGTKQQVDFMYSEEGSFLKDDQAVGFLKYYEGGKYAFAALLPEEGVSLERYIASLSGEKLNRILNDPTHIEVHASMPKFEAEYSTALGEPLSNMGISDAFDEVKADFSEMVTSEDGNIFISRVLHKTYICVDEEGTKAAAVTAVEMSVESCAEIEPEFEIVRLDRPFVYFLIDCEEGLPIFMGTVYSVE